MKPTIFLIGLLVMACAVAAEEQAGSTPDSLFYGLDRAMESIKLAMTFNPEKKANVHLQHAEERIAELQAIMEKNKTKHVEGLVEDYEESVAKAEDKIDEAESEGKNETALRARVEEMRQKHLAVLQRVLESAPESAQKGLMNAISQYNKTKTQEQAGEEQEAKGTTSRVEVTDKQPEEQAAKGTLKMQITDKKPEGLDITSLVITVSEIQVHAAGAAGSTEETCEDVPTSTLTCTNTTQDKVVETCTNSTSDEETCVNVTVSKEVCTNYTVDEEVCEMADVVNQVCTNASSNETDPETNETVEVVNEVCENVTSQQEVCSMVPTLMQNCTTQDVVELSCTPTGEVVVTCKNETIQEEVTTCEYVNSTTQNCTKTESSSNESGWMSVVTGPKTYDLIQIKDVKELLGSVELTAGKYTQIRLSIDKAELEISNKTVPVKIPSEKLKLIKSFDIKEGQVTTLTLDFDAESSVHTAGTGYMMRPTIKIIVG